MMLLLVVLLGMYLRGIKNGERLWAIKPASLQKRGFFTMLLLIFYGSI